MTMSSTSSSSASERSARKRVVFLGTPDVAAESLGILLEEKDKQGYDIVAVVSQPPVCEDSSNPLLALLS
jgi:hypothetical protein